MVEQRIWIVTSLAIHAGFLFLFFTMPFTSANPYKNIIFLSFAQEDVSPSVSQKKANPIIGSKTELRSIIKSEVVKIENTNNSENDLPRSINKPEAVEIGNTNDKAIITDKPAVVVEEKTGEQISAKTAIASLGRAENQGIVETSFGNTGAPAFIRREVPAYPLLARRLGKEGKVVLRLLIDKDGMLHNIEVIEQSGFGFTEAAIAAIQKSTFSPAYRNGEKLASKAILSVRFNLQ